TKGWGTLEFVEFYLNDVFNIKKIEIKSQYFWGNCNGYYLNNAKLHYKNKNNEWELICIIKNVEHDKIWSIDLDHINVDTHCVRISKEKNYVALSYFQIYTECKFEF